MYMYICEHAYFWDEQKGEERKTPGCRLAVGRPRALKPFPTARPSPAPLQPSLHPPSPRFGQCTNMTDTLMLRCATLGSTLCCWPNLQPVDGLREPKRCQSFSRFPPAVLLPQTSRLPWCCPAHMRRALYADVRASALPNRQSRRAARPAEASRPARPAPSTPLPRLRPFCTAPTMAARTRSRWCSSTPSSDQGLPSVSTLPPSCSPRSGGEETAAPLFATAFPAAGLSSGCFTNTLRGRICEKTPLSHFQIYYCN